MHNAIAERATGYLSSVTKASAQHVTNIAWGLIHQGVYNPAFFTRLRTVFPGLAPHIVGPGYWQVSCSPS